MSHRQPILANVALWVAGFGLLTLGLCCWAAPGFADGWISGCHGPGSHHCSPVQTDPCMPTVGAVATDGSKVELSGGDPMPSATVLRTRQARIALDPGHSSVTPVSVPPTGVPSPAVFLLHSSFLL